MCYSTLTRSHTLFSPSALLDLCSHLLNAQNKLWACVPLTLEECALHCQFLWSFGLCMCAHKSLVNAFPRSDLVRGNVVTHLIFGPSAWLSPEWPHLTPPVGSVTDPHLSHLPLLEIPHPLFAITLSLFLSMTAGLQVNSRNWGQQKIVPPPDNVAVTNKRRPGRPRKYPLPSDESPAHTPSTVMSPPKLLPGLSRDGTEAEERRDARAESHQQMSEVELQAKRKKGRKRKHNSSPCHQRYTLHPTPWAGWLEFAT